MSLLKKCCILLSLTLVASCALTPYERLSNAESNLKTRGGYNSYLALEYLEFSRNLLSIKKTRDAEYFSQKGLNIVELKPFIPENPIKWNADKAQMEELVLMQKRMELVLDHPHVKFYLPIQTAHLSYLYDCWISRESKALFRVSDLAQCKTRFYKLLEEIEYYIDDLSKDRQPKTKIKEPAFDRFEILFDLNNYKLNDKANKDMFNVLKYLKTLEGQYHILVVGNADRVGLELYNEGLAMKRAEVVKNALIKNGVIDSLIELRSVGEDFPDIISADGSQLQRNRVVGIYIMKSDGSFADYPLPLVKNYVYREEVKQARRNRGLK